MKFFLVGSGAIASAAGFVIWRIARMRKTTRIVGNAAQVSGVVHTSSSTDTTKVVTRKIR